MPSWHSSTGTQRVPNLACSLCQLAVCWADHLFWLRCTVDTSFSLCTSPKDVAASRFAFPSPLQDPCQKTEDSTDGISVLSQCLYVPNVCIYAYEWLVQVVFSQLHSRHLSCQSFFRLSRSWSVPLRWHAPGTLPEWRPCRPIQTSNRLKVRRCFTKNETSWDWWANALGKKSQMSQVACHFPSSHLSSLFLSHHSLSSPKLREDETYHG